MRVRKWPGPLRCALTDAILAHDMASLPFRDRPPTDDEFERLRLTVSGFRDGSGQILKDGRTYPGWRDFERSMASVFNGRPVESKVTFDVEMPGEPAPPYGLSCKTRQARLTDDFCLMELTNSSAKMWRRLNDRGIDPASKPKLAGMALIELVEEWQVADGVHLDLARSSYVHLAHDLRHVSWRITWYPLDLRRVKPEEMEWVSTQRRLVGRYEGRAVWEWYGASGGQLKYSPPIAWASWVSEWFSLEDPPVETPAQRASRYWPGLWPDSGDPKA